MQQVVKVSIGNIAFTLDKDAHAMMGDYLDSLKSYYRGSANCGEILSEIESRIAELLTDRGYRDKVIPAEAVQEIINILGRPEDFDGETESEEKRSGKKRVYRDPDNKIIGGVCGGLGAYFSVDPLVFRITFAVWILFFFWLEIFEDWGWGMSVLGMFAYIVFWIAMPEANTVEQRYRMKGGSVSLKNIQKTVEREARDVSSRVGKGIKEGVRSTGDFWKAMGRGIEVFMGILLLLIGMAGTATIVLAAFGLGLWNGLYAFGTSWFLSLISETPAWATTLISVLTWIVASLPFIGMLYAGILMLFRLKAPRWKPGLILFIIWVISLLGLIGVSLGSISTLRSMDTQIKHAQLPASDTLYIEFAGASEWSDNDVLIDANQVSYDLIFMGKDKDNPLLVVYPDLYLNRHNDDRTLRSYTRYITEGMNLGQMARKDTSSFWTLEGQTLRLEPIIFSTDARVVDIERRITLNIGENTKVIVKEPVHHEFEGYFDFCSNRLLRIIEELD